MSVSVEPQLAIHLEGATAEQIERGIAAAQAVFAAAGTTAYDAALARFQRDGSDFYVQDDLTISDDWMTPEQASICMVWDEAEEAAIATCCAGWTSPPTTAHLKLTGIPGDVPQPIYFVH